MKKSSDVDSQRLFGARVTVAELIPLLVQIMKHEARPDLPIVLWGPPGTGKSSAAREAAEILKQGVVWYGLPTTDYNNVCGMPWRDPEKGRWIREPIIHLPQDGEGVFVIEDTTHAPVEVQNVILDLALYRRLNDFYIAKGWLIVFTANESGNVHPMTPAAANRMLHFYVYPEFHKTWKPYAIKKGLRSDVIGFLDSEPDRLSVPPDHQEKAFASPRTWEKLSVLLDVFHGREDDEGAKRVNSQDKQTRFLIESAVGTATANKMLAYLEVAKLIDFQAVLSGEIRSLEPFSERSSSKLQTLQFALMAQTRAWWTRTQRNPKHLSKGFGNIVPLLDEVYRGVLIRDLVGEDKRKLGEIYSLTMSGPAAPFMAKALAELEKVMKTT